VRLVVGAVAIVAVVLVGYYVITVYQVWRAARRDGARPSQAIIVLGAAQYNGKPSPVLRARLDHASDLYREGLAPTVVVTGGIGTGDRVSEATVGRQYLVAHGVPENAVVVRPEGRSTQASMESVAQWAQAHQIKRVLLVSDPFHMLRLRLEAGRTSLIAFTSPTSSSPISADWRTELYFFAAEAWKVPVVLLRMT
jgi:uncharacterized SAM-binding protein YcdF (DUF218 family)